MSRTKIIMAALGAVVLVLAMVIQLIAGMAVVPLAALGIGFAGTANAPAAHVPTHTVSVEHRVMPAPTKGLAFNTLQMYYKMINRKNYAGAWGLYQKPNGSGGNAVNAVTGQTYAQFVAGYRSTKVVRISPPLKEVLTPTADTVWISLFARHYNGVLLTYIGSYTVNGNGLIVGAHVKLVRASILRVRALHGTNAGAGAHALVVPFGPVFINNGRVVQKVSITVNNITVIGVKVFVKNTFIVWIGPNTFVSPTNIVPGPPPHGVLPVSPPSNNPAPVQPPGTNPPSTNPPQQDTATLPDVTGEPANPNATSDLGWAGFSNVNVVQVAGSPGDVTGNVLQESPAAGSVIPKNTKITITVCAGIPVPDETGKDVNSATSDLGWTGFSNVAVSPPQGDTDPMVTSQTPQPGTMLLPNAAITLFTG